MKSAFSKSFGAVVATLAMFGAASSALAWQSRIEDDGREALSGKQAERTMRDFAQCVVANKKREAKALEFLQLPDGDPQQNMQGSAIALSGCAPRGSQMRFQPELFSRSIYTALYRKYYLKSAPANLAAIAPADYQTEYTATSIPVGTMQLALRTFADCTVKQDGIAAHNFAISEMQSKGEKETVPAVIAAMQQCLNTGATLRFSRTILKGLIAESLYKLRSRQRSIALNAAQ